MLCLKCNKKVHKRFHQVRYYHSTCEPEVIPPEISETYLVEHQKTIVLYYQTRNKENFGESWNRKPTIADKDVKYSRFNN